MPPTAQRASWDPDRSCMIGRRKTATTRVNPNGTDLDSGNAVQVTKLGMARIESLRPCSTEREWRYDAPRLAIVSEFVRFTVSELMAKVPALEVPMIRSAVATWGRPSRRRSGHDLKWCSYQGLVFVRIEPVNFTSVLCCLFRRADAVKTRLMPATF